MREIKFRAWDLEEEEYISWDKLIHTRYNQDYICDNENSIGPFLSFMTDKHLQLEQFTGLLDKNGKEIYEGDIVKGVPCWDICEVKYSNVWASFYVARKNSYGIGMADTNTESWYYKSNALFWYYNDSDDEYDGEPLVTVIGNINENPELLNDRA